jgi:hypothetical protein
MSESERVGWDPVLMSVLSACVIQDRFGLASKSIGNGASTVGSRSVTGISQQRIRTTLFPNTNWHG